MKHAASTALIAVTLIFAFSASAATRRPHPRPTRPGVIYGTDDRKDLYQVKNQQYKALAGSTVALMQLQNLSSSSRGTVTIHAETLTDLMHVCREEPFATQPSGAFCSGSLIAKNMILTAGHCITDQESCNNTRMIFGYDVTTAQHFPTQVNASEVYACKSIIHREQNNTGADFGIILLDRDVVGHAPLKIANRAGSTIANNTKLLMIGHPSGLPTKLDDGGIVRNSSPNGFFVATTDSYGGNSGSAVFNQATGLIEGVLVRGENDFVRKGQCYVSYVCPEDGCRGEDVTKVSSITPFIPASFRH